MKIRATEIGTMSGFGWLIIEEGELQSSIKLTPEQMRHLAHDIISRLREYSRNQREFYNGMNKQLSELNVGKSDE